MHNTAKFTSQSVKHAFKMLFNFGTKRDGNTGRRCEVASAEEQRSRLIVHVKEIEKNKIESVVLSLSCSYFRDIMHLKQSKK